MSPDNRTGEERVMDAAWGRLEAPETAARRREEARRNAVPHVIKEGSREHVLSWSGHVTGHPGPMLTWRGRRHCSEPRCEVNLEDMPDA